MGWAGVIPRFSTFDTNIQLSADQQDDGATKVRGITRALNRAYRELDSETANSLVVGSWGKGTAIRPPSDVDMFYLVPVADYNRLELLPGNRQSRLLQEVRSVLLASYPQTAIRGDGQVVVVGFNSLTIEVVPCFLLENGKYYICDTHDGGSYTIADPTAEFAALNAGDVASGSNLRVVVRLLKAWRNENNVPLKSYILEALVTQFMAQSQYASNGYFWYDWIMRDFFSWLALKGNGIIWLPDGNIHALGDDWLTRTKTARGRALIACDHEYNNRIPEAGDQWQMIFGPMIPKHVTPTPGL